jgi:hypothetical protein
MSNVIGLNVADKTSSLKKQLKLTENEGLLVKQAIESGKYEFEMIAKEVGWIVTRTDGKRGFSNRLFWCGLTAEKALDRAISDLY